MSGASATPPIRRVLYGCLAWTAFSAVVFHVDKYWVKNNATIVRNNDFLCFFTILMRSFYYCIRVTITDLQITLTEHLITNHKANKYRKKIKRQHSCFYFTKFLNFHQFLQIQPYPH